MTPLMCARLVLVNVQVPSSPGLRETVRRLADVVMVLPPQVMSAWAMSQPLGSVSPIVRLPGWTSASIDDGTTLAVSLALRSKAPLASSWSAWVPVTVNAKS